MPRVDELIDRLGKARYISTLDLTKGYCHGWEEHLTCLQVVLDALRQAGLTANPNKCKLVFEEVEYLWYLIRRGNVKPQGRKVHTMDACDTGLRAVLSQVHDGEEHPIMSEVKHGNADVLSRRETYVALMTVPSPTELGGAYSRLSGAYRVSVKTGDSITIPCSYHHYYIKHFKYLCKGDRFDSCSLVVNAKPPKGTDKASISDDINQLTMTVTMTDLEPEDSGRYYCAVDVNGGQYVRVEWFHLSVIPGTPELYVDQQEVTGVERGSVIVNCYYSNTGNRKGWCRIGGSSGSCVGGDSGTLDGTSVTLHQTTDAPRGNALTVTMSGLKMENTGWYMCGVGDLMMPVHITVRRQTTTQSTTTMTTTQAPTTEQSSFSPAAEPVQTDNTVQGPEGGKEKDSMR
ncbi:uncharacterized protein [Salvelinus alpinus]|uniref:uncharacterized protein n=1 Tax=Salvelinus alpinus TaxID=8036 RepID=UPI0039FD9377